MTGSGAELAVSDGTGSSPGVLGASSEGVGRSGGVAGRRDTFGVGLRSMPSAVGTRTTGILYKRGGDAPVTSVPSPVGLGSGQPGHERVSTPALLSGRTEARPVGIAGWSQRIEAGAPGWGHRSGFGRVGTSRFSTRGVPSGVHRGKERSEETHRPSEEFGPGRHPWSSPRLRPGRRRGVDKPLPTRAGNEVASARRAGRSDGLAATFGRSSPRSDAPSASAGGGGRSRRRMRGSR